MPQYFPIDIGVSVKSTTMDISGINWTKLGIVADFFMPKVKRQLLRITFRRECIIRLLDEWALDTEDDTACEGLIPEHFAYRVEGAAFANVQSKLWKEVRGPVTHYQFITGWTCMDVLTASAPSFEVIASS